MDQILDRLIDDAKLKCEEAQRLCLMHNNAMAALAKLKVGAKARGVTFAESDARLLAHSCKLYLESLDMLSENSKPSEVIGEAIMSGCVGFRSSQKTFRSTALLGRNKIDKACSLPICQMGCTYNERAYPNKAEWPIRSFGICIIGAAQFRYVANQSLRNARS